jgi:hypothetical protein
VRLKYSAPFRDTPVWAASSSGDSVERIESVEKTDAGKQVWRRS